MKRIFRKNQLVVTALALMIAAAGYLNYTYEADEDEIAAMAEKENDAEDAEAKETGAVAK